VRGRLLTGYQRKFPPTQPFPLRAARAKASGSSVSSLNWRDASECGRRRYGRVAPVAAIRELHFLPMSAPHGRRRQKMAASGSQFAQDVAQLGKVVLPG
jgi:hypothetical protein